MGSDFDSINDVLKHSIRRKIVLTLNESKSLSYGELMSAVEVANTGKFNYHLKILADLIEKNQNGKYSLTEKGQLAAEFLQKFPEKTVQSTHLAMVDALLIGFVGFLFTLANPGFWAFMLAAAMNVQSILFFSVLQPLSSIFTIFVPGALMWKLASRRAKSHDSYDLYKGPLFAFIMLLLLLILMFLFSFNIGAQVSIQVGSTVSSGDMPDPSGAIVSWSRSTHTVFLMGLPQLIMGGLVFSFLGVSIAEFVNRIKKKWTLRR